MAPIQKEPAPDFTARGTWKHARDVMGRDFEVEENGRGSVTLNPGAKI
jgi:hypothetical protein